MSTKETIVLILSVLLAAIILFAGMGGIIYLMEKNLSCPQTGEALQKPTKYSFWAGCFIQLENGQWIRSGNYQGVNLEK